MKAIKNRKGNIVLFILVAVLVYLPFLKNFYVDYLGEDQIDFPSYFVAANIAFNNEQSPYSNVNYERYEDNFERVFPYLYPPPSLLIFYPLSWYKYETASVLWLTFNHLLVLGALAIMLVFVLRYEHFQLVTLAFLVYLFNFQPLDTTLRLGQVNLLVLFSLLFFWFLYKRQKYPFLVSVPLVLAIILKVYPGLFLIFLLIKKEFQILKYIGISLGILLLLSILFLPLDIWHDYFVHVIPSGGYLKTHHDLFSPAAPWNQNINAFISRIFYPNQYSQVFFDNVLLGRVITYTLCIGVIVISFLKLKKLSNYDNSSFAILLLTMFLIAPLSWEHHLVFILPVVFYLFLKLSIYKISIKVLIFLSLLVFAFNFPLEANTFKNGLLTLFISIKFFAVLLVWIILIYNDKYLTLKTFKNKLFYEIP